MQFSKRFVSQCYPKVSSNGIKVIETDEGVLELDILDVGACLGNKVPHWFYGPDVRGDLLYYVLYNKESLGFI